MTDDQLLAESAWGRAVAEAGRTYRSSTFAIGAAIVTLLAGFIAALATAGEDAEHQALVGVVAGLGALALLLLATFLALLVAAPVRQRNELRSRLRALERHDPEAARSRGELRVAAAEISEELEHVKTTLRDEAGWSRYFSDYDLPSGVWANQGGVLAAHGHRDAHRSASAAYLVIDAINRTMHRDYSGGIAVAAQIDAERVKEALPLIDNALAKLAKID